MIGLPGRQRSLTISLAVCYCYWCLTSLNIAQMISDITLAVWIECTNLTDRRTDGQTDTGPQQRPRLRLASRGKNGAEVAFSETWCRPGKCTWVSISAVTCLLTTFYRATLCVSAVFAVARCPSVRLSVCLSHWCIVSRWLKISSNFFLGPVAP